ncbi:MAG: hypothetical protein ACUVXA_17500 [Candidatus Jordarchaeum sp.]|uniref:hypothetical protein n=1 Tax=Candidatus Jordarchaeum sp. TaxID=2823881 RepID=UPI004049F0D4
MMKNWGRILAMIFGIISMIMGIGIILIPIIPTFGFLIGLLLLALGIGIVIYLAGDVKYEFQ